MGSCISRSPAPPPSTVGTAKVVDLDGSIARYATPVTAREALGSDAVRESGFLCSSDELRFDEPARALAAEEVLQPGWLYFVLPVSILGQPISGQEMAALAVRASSALSVAANGAKKASRVAPLVGADEGERNQHVYGKYGQRKTASSRRAVVRRLSAILEASES
jgi:hypothetical protein